MNILILGCGGFIGSHLTSSLLNKNYKIVGIDLKVYKIRDKLSNPKFTFYNRDIYEDKIWIEEIVKRSDIIIFLSSLCNPFLYNTRPVETIRSNFIRPHIIVDLCSKYKKWLISVSTCEVYGRTISSYIGDNYSDEKFYVQREDLTPMILGPVINQRWSYACAKQLLDRYIYAHGFENNLPFTIIRPYNFFGSYMDYLPGKNGAGIPRVLACFINALMNNEPLRVVDGGRVTRTITYIDDAIDAFVKVIENREKAVGQIFNIGNPDNEVTIYRLAQLIRNSYAVYKRDDSYREHPIIEVSSKEFYGEGYEDCDRRVADISKAHNLLGWYPKIGLEETVEKSVINFCNCCRV